MKVIFSYLSYLPFFFVWLVYLYNLIYYPPRIRWIIGGIAGFIGMVVNVYYEVFNRLFEWLFAIVPYLLAIPIAGWRGIENATFLNMWEILAAIPYYGLFIGYILSFTRFRRIQNKALKIQCIVIILLISPFLLFLMYVLAITAQA